MAPPFVPSIDISTYSNQKQGLDAHALSYIGLVYATVAPDAIPDTLNYLERTTASFASFLDATAVTSTDHLVSLLDAGAAHVLVTEDQVQQLQRVDNLDTSRLILLITKEASPETSKDALNGELRSFMLADLEHIQTFHKAYSQARRNDESDHLNLYVKLNAPNRSTLDQAFASGATPIIPATTITADQDAEASLIPLVDLLLAKATSDRPDGLFTTLVTDTRDVALGLVYSSKQSVAESLRTGRGVYQSRKRGLWYKGATTGDIQELVNIQFDCDQDCLKFVVRQKGRGFCHLGTSTCFGSYHGLSRLQQTLRSRQEQAPPGSYTQRLFKDPKLLNAKIQEEAAELCEATEKDHIAFEAADLLYFVLTKCIAEGVSLEDVERNLDAKSTKVKRRKGDAKAPLSGQTPTINGNGDHNNGAHISNGVNGVNGSNGVSGIHPVEKKEAIKEAASVPKSNTDPAGTKHGRISMTRYITAQCTAETIANALQRPSQRSSDMIMGIVKPIIDDVRTRGDTALLSYTHKFEKATSLKSPVLRAPFPPSLMQLPRETIEAIDISFENIRRFHAAQQETKPLSVETMPGVVCSRFSKPIERVGLYVPGGTAVLPSTALMLGVPAMVAGCKNIVLASPPRSDGRLTPEVVYAAHKVGAESIVLAGGAQAVAAMAYGTDSVTKVDKILGPGNQFVTAAKMLVSNDTTACVSIDMPAGPSEVLVIADSSSNPAFVASDLLSQAEHGVDSQVILIAVGMSEAETAAVEEELHTQASALPRVDIVRGAIEHSVTLVVPSIAEAMRLSNQYAPEHLIIQTAEPEAVAELVEHAGSVFIGPWTPESVGDYSAGVNHSLPTYGYARQYSGVNLGSFQKHITSSKLTRQGLRNVGTAVMQLAKVEELEAHRRAVEIRLDYMDRTEGKVTAPAS